jgi:hypothetical protein
MPPQLKRGLEARKRRANKSPRPIAELMRFIDINVLIRYGAFPNDWYSTHTLHLGFRYPFAPILKVSANGIKATLQSGRIQTIGLKWIKTGLGKPRPMFICRCSRPVRKLYYSGDSLLCRRCCNVVHACQVCDKHSRPALKQRRLETFLALKKGMRQSTKQQLKERTTGHAKPFTSQRVKDRALLPQTNYRVEGEPLDLGIG